jgi:chromosome segregation ATPase
MTLVSEIALPSEAGGDREKAARGALRLAIERRDLVRGELAEAEKAATLASRRLRETEEEVEALERKRARPDMALASASALVESVMDGRSLAAGAEAVGDRERRLRAEVEALRSARDRLTRELAPSLRGRLEFAEVKVEEAARGVITSSGAVAKLMEGLTELSAEVMRRKSGLSFALGLMKRGPAWEQVSSAVYDAKPPSVMLDEHPERARWKAWLSRLQADAGAQLGEGD